MRISDWSSDVCSSDLHETVISADLTVTLAWREEIRRAKNGKAVMGPRTRTIKREKYLDGHKIDYVKGKVAFDLEWNSKDQTFDRDLYAMNAFLDRKSTRLNSSH